MQKNLIPTILLFLISLPLLTFSQTLTLSVDGMKNLYKSFTAFFILFFVSISTHIYAQQVISTSTNTTVVIQSGQDFVVNSGVILSNTSNVAIAGSSSSAINLANFTNNGSFTASSYIMSAYVRFMESSGARVVPIIYDESFDDIKEKLSHIDGLLFPGGNGQYQ